MENRRAFAMMAGAVQAMIASMGKNGQNVFNKLDISQSVKAASKRLKKLAGGGRISGHSYKPNGARECARRMRQIKAGTMTPNYRKATENNSHLCAPLS